MAKKKKIDFIAGIKKIGAKIVSSPLIRNAVSAIPVVGSFASNAMESISKGIKTVAKKVNTVAVNFSNAMPSTKKSKQEIYNDTLRRAKKE